MCSKCCLMMKKDSAFRLPRFPPFEYPGSYSLLIMIKGYALWQNTGTTNNLIRFFFLKGFSNLIQWFFTRYITLHSDIIEIIAMESHILVILWAWTPGVILLVLHSNFGAGCPGIPCYGVQARTRQRALRKIWKSH